MKIRMKTKIAGTRNAVRWPEAGGVVDLPEGEARELIAAGLAEASDAKDEESPEPEKATAPKPTTRRKA